jgi:hypothetical protein
MELRPFLRAKNSFVHPGGVAVTRLPLSGLVQIQLGKIFNKNNDSVCVEGFESLTPLHKRKKALWWGEAVISQRELLAGNMALLFTSSKPETVELEVIIWTSSSRCINLGSQAFVS